MHVEDHPLDYADFEGEIPAGQYGAGTVEIWDRGTYELVEEKKDGGLTVRLHGTRLDGSGRSFPPRSTAIRSNWLLLRKDGGARAGASLRADARHRDRRAADRARAGRSSRSGTAIAPSRGSAAAWRRSAAATATTSRRASRQSPRAVALAVRSPSAVLDGEICALDETGRSGFGLLQRGEGALVFVAFDLLELDGEPLARTYLSRAAGARSRASWTRPSRGVLLSPSFDDGAALEQAAREHGLEGVVAKRVDSPYRPGRRSPDWRKLKLKRRQELVIAGFTRGKGRRSGGIGALVLGVHGAGRAALRRQRRAPGFTDARARPARARC